MKSETFKEAAMIMIRRRLRATIVLVSSVVVLVAGCSKPSVPPIYPVPVPSNAGQKAVDAYSVAKGGFIETKDLERTPALKAAFAGVPRDEGGRIAPQGVEKRIQAWKVAGFSRILVVCHVTRSGRPLAGARVTFVPEDFLGPELKTGTGTTDQQGLALVSWEGVTPPGMPPGFYRIQVTKDGDNIPPRYNTATVLGHEVAADAEGARPAIEVKLEY